MSIAGATLAFEPLRLLAGALCGLAATLAWRLLAPRIWPEVCAAPVTASVPPSGSPARAELSNGAVWKAAMRTGAVRDGAVLTGGSLGLAWLLGSGPWLDLGAALLLLYLSYPLAATDLRALHIDPRVVAAGLALRLASLVLWDFQHLAPMILGLLAGAGLITLAGTAYQALRHRPGLGEGDALVLALVGAFVGWQGLFPAVFLAAAAGLLVGLLRVAAGRQGWDTPLPFTPFLCGGGLLVLVLQQAGGPGCALLPLLC